MKNLVTFLIFISMHLLSMETQITITDSMVNHMRDKNLPAKMALKLLLTIENPNYPRSTIEEIEKILQIPALQEQSRSKKFNAKLIKKIKEKYPDHPYQDRERKSLFIALHLKTRGSFKWIKRKIASDDAYKRAAVYILHQNVDCWPETVRTLIKAGVPVNEFCQTCTEDTIPCTPLMRTARWGKIETAQRLIKAGARIEMIDSEGKNALDYVTKSPSKFTWCSYDSDRVEHLRAWQQLLNPHLSHAKSQDNGNNTNKMQKVSSLRPLEEYTLLWGAPEREYQGLSDISALFQ